MAKKRHKPRPEEVRRQGTELEGAEPDWAPLEGMAFLVQPHAMDASRDRDYGEADEVAA